MCVHFRQFFFNSIIRLTSEKLYKICNYIRCNCEIYYLNNKLNSVNLKNCTRLLGSVCTLNTIMLKHNSKCPVNCINYIFYFNNITIFVFFEIMPTCFSATRNKIALKTTQIYYKYFISVKQFQ